MTQLRIGSLLLENNIIYAPMAGCTDWAFRKMARSYVSGLIFCEMVKIEALVRQNGATIQYLAHEDMHPIGAQICGSNPKLAGEAAKMIEDMGFDVIDLNCGCPVKKVVKDGSGAAILKTPELIGEMLYQMIKAVKIPVTIKTRIGWDADSICAAQVVDIAESVGASAITIHGRTRAQGYSGKADWSHIAACKAGAKKIPVIGNGDIYSPEDAMAMLEQTGCDGVMAARGALGSPWLAADIVRHLSGEMVPERDASWRKEQLQAHYRLIMSRENEIKALLEMRKISFWYLKNYSGCKKLRIAINCARTPQEIIDLVYAG